MSLSRNVSYVLTTVLALSAVVAVGVSHATAAEGVVEFTPVGDETALPEQFRLKPGPFPYEQSPLPTRGTIMTVSKVTFPSPVVTPQPNNNTVHCEYFCPTSAGNQAGRDRAAHSGRRLRPGAAVLPRAGRARAWRRCFLKMPYYGERQQPGDPTRMISVDPEQTVSGMTQAVLDVRRAAAWLAAQRRSRRRPTRHHGHQPGWHHQSAGLRASSRGSTRPALMLAGGDMGEVAWTSTEMTELREKWTAEGHTKEELFEMLRTVDPVTYAGRAGPQDPDAQRQPRRSRAAGLHQVAVARLRRAGDRLVGRRPLHRRALSGRTACCASSSSFSRTGRQKTAQSTAK